MKEEFSLLKVKLLIVTVAMVVFGAPLAADSITTKTFNKLTEAQEMMAQDNIEAAIEELELLLEEVQDQSLDRALTLQMLGYAEMSAERFEVAIGHLRSSLELNKLPESVKYNVGYMVAQLYAALERYDEALDFAADWFVSLESPKPSQMMFMANIYAQTKRFRDAIPYAENAIEASDQPSESWYQLITSANFEIEDFPQAGKWLLKLVERWPEKGSYWEQLASIYVMMEDEAMALSTLRLAWSEGVLDREASIKSMVQLAAARGIPDHAARMIESGFEQGLLPRDETFVRLLANALVSAKENKLAIGAFRRLSEIAKNGEPLVRVANLYLEMGQWQQAEQALEKAIDLGLDDAGSAYLLLGIVLAEQDNYKESFVALRRARSFEKTQRQAAKWLSYAEDMRKQYEWQRAYRG